MNMDCVVTDHLSFTTYESLKGHRQVGGNNLPLRTKFLGSWAHGSELWVTSFYHLKQERFQGASPRGRVEFLAIGKRIAEHLTVDKMSAPITACSLVYLPCWFPIQAVVPAWVTEWQEVVLKIKDPNHQGLPCCKNIWTFSTWQSLIFFSKRWTCSKRLHLQTSVS